MRLYSEKTSMITVLSSSNVMTIIFSIGCILSRLSNADTSRSKVFRSLVVE